MLDETDRAWTTWWERAHKAEAEVASLRAALAQEKAARERAEARGDGCWHGEKAHPCALDDLESARAQIRGLESDLRRFRQPPTFTELADLKAELVPLRASPTETLDNIVRRLKRSLKNEEAERREWQEKFTARSREATAAESALAAAERSLEEARGALRKVVDGTRRLGNQHSGYTYEIERDAVDAALRALTAPEPGGMARVLGAVEAARRDAESDAVDRGDAVAAPAPGPDAGKGG